MNDRITTPDLKFEFWNDTRTVTVLKRDVVVYTIVYVPDSNRRMESYQVHDIKRGGHPEVFAELDRAIQYVRREIMGIRNWGQRS